MNNLEGADGNADDNAVDIGNEQSQDKNNTNSRCPSWLQQLVYDPEESIAGILWENAIIFCL